MISDEEIKHNLQKHILHLTDIGFINLTERQNKLIEAFAQKYQKCLPNRVYRDLVKDATKLILFS